jgi:hypothetical protein
MKKSGTKERKLECAALGLTEGCGTLGGICASGPDRSVVAWVHLGTSIQIAVSYSLGGCSCCRRLSFAEHYGKGRDMRFFCMVTIVGLSMLGVAGAQDGAPKPKVSKDSLTAEQIAIYRAVLQDYMKDSDDSLNLADKTVLLDQPGQVSEEECMKGLKLENSGPSAPVVHQLDRAVALNANMVLVDPDAQQKKVEENDPQKLMKRAIDEGEQVSEKEIDSSVKQAFATGLFTLSEIVFDKAHKHALVEYSFECGGLCGSGEKLVLERTGRKWRISKRCGKWVA